MAEAPRELVDFLSDASLVPFQRILIGRGTDADIKLEHDTVSRRHAELLVAGGLLFVRDLESTGGTFVGSEPVREQRPFHPEEILRVGAFELTAHARDGLLVVCVRPFVQPQPTRGTSRARRNTSVLVLALATVVIAIGAHWRIRRSTNTDFSSAASTVAVAPDPPPQTPPPPTTAPDAVPVRYEIRVFVADDCAACEVLKLELRLRRLHFDELNSDEHRAEYFRLVASTGGAAVVPITTIDREGRRFTVVGNQPDEVERAALYGLEPIRRSRRGGLRPTPKLAPPKDPEAPREPPPDEAPPIDPHPASNEPYDPTALPNAEDVPTDPSPDEAP